MCRGSSSSDGNIRKESGNLVAYSTVLPNNSLSFGVVCSFTSQQHKEEKKVSLSSAWRVMCVYTALTSLFVMQVFVKYKADRIGGEKEKKN